MVRDEGWDHGVVCSQVQPPQQQQQSITKTPALLLPLLTLFAPPAGTDAWSIHKGSCGYGWLDRAVATGGARGATDTGWQTAVAAASDTPQVTAREEYFVTIFILLAWGKELATSSAPPTPDQAANCFLLLPIPCHTGWDVAAITDKAHDFHGSCG